MKGRSGWKMKMQQHQNAGRDTSTVANSHLAQSSLLAGSQADTQLNTDMVDTSQQIEGKTFAVKVHMHEHSKEEVLLSSTIF